MRPLFVEQRCLKCHAEQGYQVGALRGGISVSVPMAPLWAVARRHMAVVASGLALVWLLGLGGLGLGARRISERVRERKRMEGELRRSRDFLQTIIDLESTGL